jgi:hypothetical protein
VLQQLLFPINHFFFAWLYFLSTTRELLLRNTDLMNNWAANINGCVSHSESQLSSTGSTGQQKYFQGKECRWIIQVVSEMMQINLFFFESCPIPWYRNA